VCKSDRRSLRRTGAVGLSPEGYPKEPGWPGGIIQASRHGLFVTPIYLVNQLYSNHAGAVRLSAKTESPTFDSTREGRNIPALDAVVSRLADGRRIFIKAVNSSLADSLKTEIRLTGAQIASNGVMEIVTADSLTAANSYAAPRAVSIRRAEFKAGNSFSVELPRHSVSVITLNVEK
jgi:alpha-L-arabinofuranosidase